MDHGTRTVRRAGETIELTLAEYALLEKLITAAGRIVSREELVKDVLHRSLSPFDRSMDTHVANLRRKLGHQVNGVERIKTFVASVIFMRRQRVKVRRRNAKSLPASVSLVWRGHDPRQYSFVRNRHYCRTKIPTISRTPTCPDDQPCGPNCGRDI